MIEDVSTKPINIVAVTVSIRVALSLMFSNGHRLTIVDSFKEYESYDITRLGQTIIV
jgi:hypothetical protein